MAEYINKAELMKELKKEFKNYESYGDYGTHPAEMKAQRVIANLPTIDIVHCSECKYWQVGNMDLGLDCHTYPDHFCAEGERKPALKHADKETLQSAT